MNQALAVSSNWLNQDDNYQRAGLTQLVGSYNSYCHPGTVIYPSWTYQIVSTPARPIKLKLSEIDKLRESARSDAALKAILAKFTDQIEITVDFD